MGAIPNLRIIVVVCAVAVAGYAGFSVYAVGVLRDATMTGDIIGTWKSFAVAAFAFWLGSSSGGKGKDGPPVPDDAKAAAEQVADAADKEAAHIKGEQP
jgi:hypothetical protein